MKPVPPRKRTRRGFGEARTSATVLSGEVEVSAEPCSDPGRASAPAAASDVPTNSRLVGDMVLSGWVGSSVLWNSR
jgi:hypothetical protein